jgi:hypothetical protein
VENFARYLFGTALFILGSALIGLDIHIAFRTNQFAHATNLGLGIFVLVLSLTLMFWTWLQPLFATLTDAVRAWRAK